MSEQQQSALIDGSTPATPEELFERLDELDIEAETVEHPPVFTVEEAKSLRGKIPGLHTKNLFLRDKKKAMWLLVCREDRRFDMKALADVLGSARLSFGSPKRLMQYLGVIPGAVSPFAVINDDGGNVRVVLERAMLDDGPWNFHPLDNALTTSIAPDDMIRFLEAEEHAPRLVSLP